MSLGFLDIFAGGGGSSTGIVAAGAFVVMAANHWQLAVDVHQLNHQRTDHACVDLHMEDPRNFPRTDALWASPECTKWSQANGKARALSIEMGGDPTLFDDVPVALESSDEDEITRSRLLMFDVLRFIEHHRYRVVVVENVVDIATQSKYAAAWAAWRRGLDRLGYAFRVVSLNAMHSQMSGLPAPQSRDRLYIVAWPKSEKAIDVEPALRPPAWCPRCETVVESRQAWKPGRTVGRYRAQYVMACGRCGHVVEPGWLPASEAIDWTLPADRIADRAKPLSAKTMARIREGLRRYGPLFHLEAGGNQYDSLDPKHPQHGQPGAYARVWPVTEPLRTLHTAATKGLVLDAVRSSSIIRHTDEPLATQTTAYTRSLLVPSGGTWHETAYPTKDAMRTITTRENHGLLVPYYSASETAKPTTLPVGTLTCVDRYALVVRNNSTREGESSSHLCTPVDEPLRTLTASNPHYLLEGDRAAAEVSEDDVMACRFRMLEPHEIANGMAFPRDYRWQGTKRERVRLAGNAVCPPSARDLVSVISEQVAA